MKALSKIEVKEFLSHELAYQGVVMQMIAHGISTGALFILLQHILPQFQKAR